MIGSFSIRPFGWSDNYHHAFVLNENKQSADCRVIRVIDWAYTEGTASYYRFIDKMAKTCGVFLRGLLLFMIGNFFAVFMNLLQINRLGDMSLKMPPELLENLILKEWWVPPMCGVAAAFIGLLYPCLDQQLQVVDPGTKRGEWSKVMRCIAVFVGINHASAKLDFVNNMQLSMTLAAMSIGLWWLFDRSPCGFGLGVGIAVLATLVTQLLVYNGVYNYSKAEFLFVRSWLPCIFFSGGVTMGNIGRQLATYDEEEPVVKPKTD